MPTQMTIRLWLVANDLLITHHASDPIGQEHGDVGILPKKTEVVGFTEQKQQDPQADQEQQIAEACTDLGHGVESFKNSFTAVKMPQTPGMNFHFL